MIINRRMIVSSDNLTPDEPLSPSSTLVLTEPEDESK